MGTEDKATIRDRIAYLKKLLDSCDLFAADFLGGGRKKGDRAELVGGLQTVRRFLDMVIEEAQTMPDPDETEDE